MFFGLFRSRPVATGDEDTATGTYGDGAVGTPASDRSAYAGESRAARSGDAHERDYGEKRAVTLAGAGLIA